MAIWLGSRCTHLQRRHAPEHQRVYDRAERDDQCCRWDISDGCRSSCHRIDQWRGKLIKTGTATLTLTGTSLYAGGTTMSAGTLQIGNGGTSGSIVGNVVVNSLLAFNRSDTSIFGGAISGTGSLEQRGPGTTILSGANTYTGGTIINAGTLQVGNGGVAGSIVGNVANDGAIAFNRSNALTFGGSISGSVVLSSVALEP